MYPVVLGHEFGGRIAALGGAVKGWAEGDRVVSETAAVIDPNNPMSRAGLYNLDPTRKGFGYGVDGAMTRHVRVPARCLHRVPAGLAMEVAALTEPCCVAFNAVINNSRTRPATGCVVLGPGPIGILCAAMARLAGAEVALVGLERDRGRLETAKAYGCDVIIGDATGWAKSRDGLGADGVIDAAGASAALKTALELVRPAGWIIGEVGWGQQPLNFSSIPSCRRTSRCSSFSHNWPISGARAGDAGVGSAGRPADPGRCAGPRVLVGGVRQKCTAAKL
jgi:alcohol dehydrogenase/L-iditol 2-dehydrogenase